MSIKFVSRKIIFKRNPVLARHVYDLQTEIYDPSDNIVSEGQEIFLKHHDKKPTKLTKYQADTLNREYIKYCTAMRDTFDPLPADKEHIGTIIAETLHEDFATFTQHIGTKILQLSKKMGWKNILFISDSRFPYLVQKNKYKPVKMARRALREMGVKKKYKDGIILSDLSIDSFFSTYYWIVRYNASAPTIYFSSKASNIIGGLCKYGNIHFECYDRQEQQQLQNALAQVGFTEIENGICRENFSTSAIMTGREIELD